MAVYKKRKSPDAPYVFEYRDHLGRRRIKTGTTDREETRDIGAEIRKKVRLRRAGLIDPTEERFEEERRKPLSQHMTDYVKALESTDCTKKHIKLTQTRINTIIRGCRFDAIHHLESPAAQRYLAKFADEHDLGPKTYNHYVQALVAFGNWLKEAGRIRSNPFESIQRRKPSKDIRRRRRSLSPTEMSQLVMSAITSEQRVQGYDGLQRSRAYLLSYLTGLRQNEVGHLRMECFDLSANPQLLRLEAKFTKNGETVELPMHPQLVELITEWLPELTPGQPLLPNFSRKKAWLMVKKDLERIGLPYRTNDGTADYHAIGRCSYITQLLVNGVPIHQAMKLARHHSIEMTQRYAKVNQNDAVQAMNKLPGAPICGQWKSQCLKGNESPRVSSTVPQKSPRRRVAKSDGISDFVPQGTLESGGGDECRTPLKKWRRRESNLWGAVL